MLKKISLLLLILFLTFEFSGNLYSETLNVYRVLYTLKGNCNGTGYASVNRWSEVTQNPSQGVTITTEYINCSGSALEPCPDLDCSIHPNDNSGINQAFLDISFSLMSNYVQSQIILGNLEGNQSFDTYYQNTPVYRNISWNYLAIYDGISFATISVGGIFY